MNRRDVRNAEKTENSQEKATETAETIEIIILAAGGKGRIKKGELKLSFF